MLEYHTAVYARKQQMQYDFLQMIASRSPLTEHGNGAPYAMMTQQACGSADDR